jgi:phage gpG-like protein
MKVTAIFRDETISGVETRMKNLKPFYEASGELLVNSIMKNFEAQGRPERWKPLSAATLLGGAGYGGLRMTKRGKVSKGFERHLQGKTILQRSGRLKNSIIKEATAEHVVVGSTIPGKTSYGAIHNFGGMAGVGKKVFIPARPYIMVQDEDHMQMTELLRRWTLVGTMVGA